MPQIKCDAIFCLHNNYKEKKCGVTEDTVIEIIPKGKLAECFDYSPVTNQEYYLCTGVDRKDDIGGLDLES